MSEIYSTGSEGEKALAEFLVEQGRRVEPSDTKTFDFIVDGKYAEVKSSRDPYAKLGFIGLTANQFQAKWVSTSLSYPLDLVVLLRSGSTDTPTSWGKEREMDTPFRRLRTALTFVCFWSAIWLTQNILR